MEKEKVVKIEILKGYEIDKDKSTFEKIVFKAIKNELPKTVKDLKGITGHKIDLLGEMIEVHYAEADDFSRSVWPTKELVKAALALSQLCQLRDRYNGDWRADFHNDMQTKYVIWFINNKVKSDISWQVNSVLAFKTAELRDEFYDNFKDLIEIAKPLL